MYLIKGMYGFNVVYLKNYYIIRGINFNKENYWI